MKNIELVSVHGGHSGQFCNHATDSLEDIVKEYIRKGFSWVGITEHAPAISDDLLYPDQKEAGLTPQFLLDRFGKYIKECKRLKEKYKSEITLFPAMEIETYSGYEEFVPFLIDKFQPEYIVGSVHFVDDFGFDYSKKQCDNTASKVGGIDAMYLRYFDIQFDMIKLLKPSVVGHFDLIRIFDPEYKTRIEKPEIREKIERNLQLIKKHDLILDFNLRALLKGADEPYVTKSILKRVKELNIAIAPGDDSHGISNVGLNIETGLDILINNEFPTNWKKPVT